jgi:hypothetical protein
MTDNHSVDGRVLVRLIFGCLLWPPLRARWNGIWLPLLLLYLCCAWPPAAAQGLNLGGASDDRPIAISATSGIEWQQDAQVYIARGNATAKRGTT